MSPLEILLQNKCLQFGKYKLHSGQTSGHIWDIQRALIHPDQRKELAKSMVDIYTYPAFPKIYYGIPTGGAALAASTGERIIFSQTIKQPKNFLPVVIIDDVCTTGNSIIQTAKELRKKGWEVEGAVVLVCRDQNAIIEMDENDLRFKAVIYEWDYFDFKNKEAKHA